MTRKSRARRACGLCKPWKRLGNVKDRRPVSDLRKLQPDEKRGR